MNRTAHQQLTMSRWVVMTFTGWLIGFVFVLVLSGLLEAMGKENLGFHLGVGMGGGVGFMQWVALRKRIKVSTLWIWYSVLGFGVPYLIFDIVSLFTDTSLAFYRLSLGTGVGGVCVGLLQFLLLRKYSASAAKWIVFSFLGWTFAALTVVAVDYTKYISGNNWVLLALNLILILGGGAILGIWTGKSITSIITTSDNSRIIEH